MQGWFVDNDYVKTLGMQIKTGRGFSPEFVSDSTESVVLNESAVEKFDLGPNPLGKKISSFTANRPDGSPDPIRSSHGRLSAWSKIFILPTCAKI